MKKLFCLVSIFTIMIFLCMANRYFQFSNVRAKYSIEAMQDIMGQPPPFINIAAMGYSGCHTNFYEYTNPSTPVRVPSQERSIFSPLNNINNDELDSSSSFDLSNGAEFTKISPYNCHLIGTSESAVMKTPYLGRTALCCSACIGRLNLATC